MKSKCFAVIVAAALGTMGCGNSARTSAGQLKAGDRVSLALSADGKSVQSITSESLNDGETNDDAQASDDGDGETNDDATSNSTATLAPALTAGEILAPRADIHELSPGSFEALGMKIQAQALPDGTAVRFVGSMKDDGSFLASSTKSSRATYSALRGTLQAVERDASGTVTLRVLGQAVTANETQPITTVKSLDEESTKEDDGVDCQQEGQNEGDNESCAAPDAGNPAPTP